MERIWPKFLLKILTQSELIGITPEFPKAVWVFDITDPFPEYFQLVWSTTARDITGIDQYFTLGVAKLGDTEVLDVIKNRFELGYAYAN